MVSLNLSEDPVFTRPEILNSGGVPSAMYGVNPRTIMGPERWDALRKKVYAQNNYCCFACGVPRIDAQYHQWLEAHEIYDIDWEKGRMELKEVVALCHVCHNYIHAGRLFITGPREKFKEVLKHGLGVLKKARLKPLEGHAQLAGRALGPRYFKYLLPGQYVLRPRPRVIVPRSQWRLIFEGQEYGPLPLIRR